MSEVAGRLAAVRARVDAAAARSGRDPAAVAVVAVSKRHPAAAIDEAARAGQRLFGENYAQELADKCGQVTARLEWHFIGHLQRNKVKLVVGEVALIHGVDSERLLVAISARAEALGVTQRVLLEINVGGEAHKSGSVPELAPTLCARARELPGVELVGLMTMPPLAGDPEQSRVPFAALRDLRDRLASGDQPLAQLSMGTTGDFEVAVEEGATLVRVGTAIFGPRPV